MLVHELFEKYFDRIFANDPATKNRLIEILTEMEMEMENENGDN